MNYFEKLSSIPVSSKSTYEELINSINLNLKLSPQDYLILGNSLFYLALRAVKEEVVTILSDPKYSGDKFFLPKKEFLDIDCQLELIASGLKSLDDKDLDKDLYLAALTKVTEESTALSISVLTRTKQKLASALGAVSTEIIDIETFLVKMCNEVIRLLSNEETRYKRLEDNLGI